MNHQNARRNLILDVAREVFLAEGFAAASMAAISARLGGSKGTLYNHFKNKGDLFAGMMQREYGALQVALAGIPAQPGAPRARLVNYARRFLMHLMRPEAMALHRLAISEGDRFPAISQASYGCGPGVVIGRIATEISGLMEQGVLRSADPVTAAQQFEALAISGVYWPRLWGRPDQSTPAEIEARADCAVDTFLRAYSA